MKLTRENRSTWGKTCFNATLFTTNPTWTDPGSNPVLRGEPYVLSGYHFTVRSNGHDI
jgi:hypothetical protein